MRRFLKGLSFVILGVAGLALAAWLAGPHLLRSAGDMAAPRSEIHGSVHEGQIYTAGGIGFFRTLRSCERFDLASSAWLACPDLPRALHHVAIAAGAGKVFASGGYTGLPFTIDENPALFVLDPAKLEEGWVKLADLPSALGQHAMFYREGALYLIGGSDGVSTLADLTRYDLASGEWEELAPMPTARHSHAIASDRDHLYVTGGRSETLGTQSGVIEAYSFADNRWREWPQPPFALAGHGAAVIDGHLHVFGGENLDTGEVLTEHASLPLTAGAKEWTYEPPLPAPRHGFAAAEIDGVIWILGGGKRAGLKTPWSVTGSALSIDLQ
jgi:hypothetical protein